MDGLGCQSFAGAGFTGDQDRGIHRGDILDQVENFLHGSGLADHAFKPGSVLILLFQIKIFPGLGLVLG